MTASATPRRSRAALRRRRRRRRAAGAVVLAAGVVWVLLVAHARGAGRERSPSAAASKPASVKASPSTVPVTPTTAAARSSATDTASAAPSPAMHWTIVSLGDSVPAGTACGCSPFPAVYADDVSQITSHSTTDVNLAKPGLTSAGLLAQLAPGTAAAADLADASVVTVTIGANDFSYQPSVQCPALACYAQALQAMQANVLSLLQRIGNARQGRPTTVFVLGYWAVWKDGQVGQQQGSDYMKVNTSLTAATNRDLAAAAATTGATYVDLVKVFRPTPGSDDTDLLAPDGDHPDAAGHNAIAQALVQTGRLPQD